MLRGETERTMSVPTPRRSSEGIGARTAEHVRPFVGRIRELDELGAAFADASDGHGAVFLVCGEPGIGKSRMMEVLAASARADGWTVLVGRCWDGGGAPAYWPWVQVVRAAGGDFDALSPAGDTAAALSARRSSVSSAADADAERFRLFEDVARFLTDVSSDQPVMIVLDDLHAADEPSLLLLRFLATTADTRRVIVLGSYRESEPRVLDHGDLFGELTRLGRRVPLRGLSVEEVTSYLTLVGGEPTSDVIAARLQDVTGGNPFFLGEVVRVLIAEGRLSSADETSMRRMPEEVRALIRRHVSTLSPEAIGVLRVAAVFGHDLDLRVLADAGPVDVDRMTDAVSEAVRAGILSEDPSAPGSFAFAHDLVRETLYDDLPSGRRLELHRTAGDVLERVFRDDLGPHLAAIAHHLTRAAPLDGGERAVDYSVLAADRAVAVLAYEDAVALYERALQLLSTSESNRDRRYEILMRLGDARARSGDTVGARRCYEDAADLSRLAGDPEAVARAALALVTSAAPVRLGFGGLLVTTIVDPGNTGVALLEEAQRTLPPGDSSLRARTLARLAAELYQFHQTDRSRTLAREAVDMALRLGDPEALVESLHGRHWATLSPDTTEDRLANAQEMLLAATGAGDEEAAFLARHARLHCFLEMCDIAGVDTELVAMEQLAARIRQPFYVWHVACLHGMRALLDGRLTDADRMLATAFGIARIRQSEDVVYMYEDAQVFAIRWTQGRLEERRERTLWHGERYPIARWRDALSAAELGDERAARAEIERHARNGFSDLPRDGLWLLHACALAHACVLVGDRPRARSLYGLLSPFADRQAISVSTLPFGPVTMRLGMLATLLERWDDAEAHFFAATERCDAMGARAIRAMVLIEHSRMLVARRGSGDAARAGELLSDANAICEELDMPGIRKRARTLAPTGGVAASSVEVPRASLRREGQYWTIRYGDEMARLRDRKGLRHLRNLLASPGRELHVLELVRAESGASTEPATAEEDVARPMTEREEPILDTQAKDAYRRRLRELDDDLEEARAWHDPERASKIQAEIEALGDELGRALGLGGRDRSLPSDAERARVTVTKAIRAAVGAIGGECPELGRHLDASIRTGRFCVYAPPGQVPPRWEL